MIVQLARVQIRSTLFGTFDYRAQLVGAVVVAMAVQTVHMIVDVR